MHRIWYFKISCLNVYLLFVIVKPVVVILEIELVAEYRSVLNNLSLGNDPDNQDEYIEYVREVVKEGDNLRRQFVGLEDVIIFFVSFN